jgi:hypothetical protein
MRKITIHGCPLRGRFSVPSMPRTARRSKLRYSAYSKFLINSRQRGIASGPPTASLNVRGRLGVEYTLLFSYK